jgi:HEAT repeat protein
MRMSQPVIIGLVVVIIAIIAVTATLFLNRRGQLWSFRDLVKNPELWKEMSRGREKADQLIEDSKEWSDAQIADEVEHFLFDVSTARDDWAKGKALEQLASRVHPHVLRFLQDASLRAKVVKATGEDLVPEAPFNRACNLLGDEPPPEATAAMVLFLDEPSKYIRCDAALVLGKVGTAEIVTPIRKALSDADEHVRSYALMGLRWAVKNARLSEVCRKELSADMRRLLEEAKNADEAAGLFADFDVLQAKAFFLSDVFFRVDSHSLHEALEAMADRKIAAPRERLLTLIGDLERTELKYPQSHALREALRLLGQNHQPEDLAFLNQRLTHGDENIARGAASGLLAMSGLENFSTRLWDKSDEALSSPQRYWIAVSILDGEVNNGGFSQFFVNSSGDHWLDALAGLEAIGAKERESILREAIARFAPDSPAENRSQRQRQLAKIARKTDDPFHDLDDRYYASKEIIEVALTKYVILNASAFR